MDIWIDITSDCLTPGPVSDWLLASEGGGINLFLGATRRMTAGKETTRLAYEAHESMARKEMGQLAKQAGERFDLLRIAMIHRIGIVPVSEASVIIGVASSHRAAAFDASRWLIDELKVSVPIWKQEHYADGTTEWQGDAWLR